MSATPETPETPAPDVPAPAKASLRRRLLSGLVAVLAVAFVVWVVPFRDRCTDDGCVPGLFTTLRHTNVPLLLVLFALYLFGTFVWAARWRALLALAEVKLGLYDTWRITLEAQAGGILLPGGIAGDALRVAHVHTRAPEVVLPKVFASLLADRVIGLVTLATIAAACGFAFPGAKHDTSSLLAIIPVVALVGFLVMRHPAVARSRWVTESRLGKRFVRPILEYAEQERTPRVLGRGLLLSLVVSGTQLLCVRGIVLALGVTPEHEALVYVGTTFGMIVSALPIAPGSWGTAEAAYVFFLGQAGIPAPAAAAVCLLYRVFWYASGVVGAGSALARSRGSRRAEKPRKA